MKCVKCGGEMEEGVLVGDYGGLVNSVAIPTKFATGYKSSFFWGKTAETKTEVKVFKCVLCGYLESYAK
jgi:hypothetical protein